MNSTPHGRRPNPILIAHRLTPGANIYFQDLSYWPSYREIEFARKVMSRLARVRKSR
jgi:hypothetical protein